MMVMPNPSQSFWVVETVVLLLWPLTMLFTSKNGMENLIERITSLVRRFLLGFCCRSYDGDAFRLQRVKSSALCLKGQFDRSDLG